jgi:hypothetical protein
MGLLDASIRRNAADDLPEGESLLCACLASMPRGSLPLPVQATDVAVGLTEGHLILWTARERSSSAGALILRMPRESVTGANLTRKGLIWTMTVDRADDTRLDLSIVLQWHRRAEQMVHALAGAAK